MKILITLFINAQEVECTTIHNPDSSVTVTCTPVQKVYPQSQKLQHDFYQQHMQSIIDKVIKDEPITE